MIKICPYCKELFDPDSPLQKFCNPIHRVKYSYKNKVIKKYKEKKVIKHKFPSFVCACGHLIKLDFFPLEKKIWNINCSVCKKHYD